MQRRVKSFAGREWAVFTVYASNLRFQLILTPALICFLATLREINYFPQEREEEGWAAVTPLYKATHYRGPLAILPQFGGGRGIADVSQTTPVY